MICDGCFLKQAAGVKSQGWEPHCSGTELFSSLSLPNSPRSCSSCMSVHKRGPYSMATFPLLPKGSKREKSCLLMTFAVCNGEASCLYNGDKPGQRRFFWSDGYGGYRGYFHSAKVELWEEDFCVYFGYKRISVFCGSLLLRALYPRARSCSH